MPLILQLRLKQHTWIIKTCRFPIRPMLRDAVQLKLLMVEDDPATRETVFAMLSLLGHEVTAVGTAELALDLIESGGFSALVTDVNLPGVSGIELAQRVHERHPEVAIVFATGLGYLLAPPLPFPFSLISKPFFLDELKAALEAASRRRPESAMPDRPRRHEAASKQARSVSPE